MSFILTGSLSFILVLLAALHVYWGHGGNWPGKNRQELIDQVYGRGDRFPSRAACYGVALVLLFGASFVLSRTLIVANSAVEHSIVWLSNIFACVFLLRAIAGYLPLMERNWKPIFVRYNRNYYGPLCILLAIGFFAVARM